MASLSLKQLVIITPMGDETKNWALENIDKLTEEQRFKLTRICWETLGAIYKLELKHRLEKEIIEAGKEKRELTSEEVQRIKDKVVTEMLKRVDEVKSKSEVRAIGKDLATAGKKD